MEPTTRQSRLSLLIVPLLFFLVQLVDESQASCCCGSVCCPACCCCCPCQCVNPPLCIKLPRTCPCCCCCKPCCCCCCKPCCCCCGGGGGGRRRKRRQAIASFQRHWEFQHPIHSALPVASNSAHIQLPVLYRNLVDRNPSVNNWPAPSIPTTNATPLPPWLVAGKKEEVEEKRPLLNNLIPVLKTLMRWPKRIVDELAGSMVSPLIHKKEFEKDRLLSEKNF